MSHHSKARSELATPDREHNVRECLKDSSMAICPLRPVAHATTSQTEHGHQAYLSDHPEARVSDGRPAITLQPHLDLRSLPPKPGERDIERAPSSAAEVVDANSNLSVEHLKYRLRFCQEKIDCCRYMLEFVIEAVEAVSQTQTLYNNYVLPLLGTKPVLRHDDFESQAYAEKCLNVLDRMEALEDVDLKDLMSIHDVYERITDYTHENMDDEHNRECQYYSV